MVERLLGQLLLVDLHRNIPHLLVSFFEQDNQTSGLRVEAAGRVGHGFLDEFLDAGVGDGRLVGELIDGAAGLNGLEEGVCVRWCHGAVGGTEHAGRKGLYLELS